jgi:1,4-dihydroxy-2-naphthoate octaprenyltransferase
MENKDSLFVSIFRIAQPLVILAGLFTYSLGLGIVSYLSGTINWTNAIFGSSLVILLFLTRNFLSAYYSYPESIPSPGFLNHSPVGEPAFVETKDIQRPLLIQIGLVALSVGAVITGILIFKKVINYSEMLVLGFAFVLAYFSAVPPLKLEKRGYGELIESILVANLFPMMAFLLQESSVHILLVMTTFPLTFLYLALRIATSLEYYAHDLKYATGTLVVRMGWQQGMTLHNLSVLFSFLLVGGFLLLRMPWSLAWPIFLALPLGILQILQIQRIADGGKPLWWLLRLNSWATFFVTAYLITITLWTR